MPDKTGSTSQRKNDHIGICLTDDAAFKEKSTGFENYDFVHYAITEVDLSAIDFSTVFFTKSINYPFLISCMTGGSREAESINSRLAEAAAFLNIPLGVGSQKQALENDNFITSYRIIRQKAPGIPVLGNIGAAQVAGLKSPDKIQKLADLVSADVMVIHVNPAQEMIQQQGETSFTGLLRSIEMLAKKLSVPLIVKEVGAGISPLAASRLLDAGAAGIDTAGAGGTSWTAVEILRNNNNYGNDFWDWGLPTSYCIRTIAELKNKYHFILIGSGGINSAFDAAKALALGADLAASARIILQKLHSAGVEGVILLIKDWFDTIKKIMYLTGSQTLSELKQNKLTRKAELF